MGQCLRIVGRRGRTRGRRFFFFGDGDGGGRDWIGNYRDGGGRGQRRRIHFSERFFWVGGGNASVISSWHLHCDAAGPFVGFGVFGIGRKHV